MTTATEKTLADLVELLQKRETLPPKGSNGKKYIGGGVLGAGGVLLVWILSAILNQNTAAIEVKKDTQSNTGRIALVEEGQKQTAAALSETVSNLRVLASQVETVVERLERMEERTEARRVERRQR